MAGGILYDDMNLFGIPMKNRKLANDKIYTPDDVAKEIVRYFKPKGKILESCSGKGAFLRALPKGTEHCEIDEGNNFFHYKNKVDWIVTNPPFSKLTDFLAHSMKISDNILWLINIPALFTIRRVRMMKQAGFWIKEIRFMKQPETFVQCGRIPGAVLLQRGAEHTTKFTFDKRCFESYKNGVEK